MKATHQLPARMTSASEPWTLRRVSILLLAIIIMALVACAAPAAEEQDKNWTAAADLVETSDRVLVAKLVDSRQESIQLVDSVSGAIAGETTVLFRQFEVFESIKGTSDPEDRLWVAFEADSPGELVDGEGSVRDFRESETYVLFLKGRLRPLEYPPEFGAVLWTGNGEPAFAELVGDVLEFRAERPYLDLLAREGRALPNPNSASPFTITLEEVKDLR